MAVHQSLAELAIGSHALKEFTPRAIGTLGFFKQPR